MTHPPGIIKPTMTASEIEHYRTSHNWDTKTMGSLIGVTPQAVTLWENGQRRVPETVVRLINLFKRKPELIREF